MSDRAFGKAVYLVVFAALLALTLITYELARVPLGSWNAPLALLIAVAKASLVALFFMNLFHGSLLTRIIWVSGLLWLFIMAALTLMDYRTRGWPL